MAERIFWRSLTIVGLFAAGVMCADYPFTDDFSDTLKTYKAWKGQLPADSITRTCANGVYTIQNQHKAVTGLVYHTFPGGDTSIFTASCMISRQKDNTVAGMWLCLTVPTSGYLSGYLVELSVGGYVSLVKNESAGSSVQLFGSYYNRRTLTDTLKVSKEGNKFNIFCNGLFVGQCTDTTKTPIASGAFGLIIAANSTVVFDNVVFTGQFTEGKHPNQFIDRFNDRTIGMSWFLNPDLTPYAENDSVMSISAPESSFVYCNTLVAVDTFVSRLIVSWREGDPTNYYGIFLYGDDVPIGGNLYTTPRVLFGISGNQTCCAFMLDGSSFSPHQSDVINGKNYGATYFKDTIDIFKKTGSQYYVMNVNGYKVDSFSIAKAKFNVIGAGIFCFGGLGQKIFADCFQIGPTLTDCTVQQGLTNRSYGPTRLNSAQNRYLFNPLGRVVAVRNSKSVLNTRALVPGLYLGPNGKSEIVVKSR